MNLQLFFLYFYSLATNFSCPQEKDITLTVDRKFPCSVSNKL